MKYAVATLAASVIALAAAFTPAAEAETTLPVCQGQHFFGDYILRPHPTLDTLTPESFNGPLGENLVAAVTPRSGGDLQITPATYAMGCEEFMAKLQSLPFVEWIQPNWQQMHQGPMIRP